MTIVEFHGGPVTRRSLDKKSKHDVISDALMAMDQCDRLRARLATIERRIENLIDRKRLHADTLRAEGEGEHCDGFIAALDDEVTDLRAILNSPEGP